MPTFEPEMQADPTGHPVLDVIMNHRTIRAFTDRPVEESVVDQLIDAAMQTASSNHMQQCSIIRITDPDVRAELAEHCKQPYVADCPVFFVYLVDCARNAQIVRAHEGAVTAAADMDRFTQGFTDAALMAQTVNIAAEALGLGACFFGSVLNDAEAVIRLLELPALTFPVLGHGFGYPNQAPQLKPRIPASVRVFENRYTEQPDLAAQLEAYDRVMTDYYDLRNGNRRSSTFAQALTERLAAPRPKRAAILRAIRAQGFAVDASLADPAAHAEGNAP